MNWKAALFVFSGLLVGVLLGVLVLVNTNSQNKVDSAARRIPPAVGSTAADFNLPLLDGQSQKLSDLRGRPVIINFWATWCPPCKEEMPLLQRYAHQYPDRFVILGVDYEEETSAVQSYVQGMQINFPILLDKTGAVSELYYARNFPTTFFVDAKGVIRAQHLGLLTEELLVRYLKTIGIEP